MDNVLCYRVDVEKSRELGIPEKYLYHREFDWYCPVAELMKYFGLEPECVTDGTGEWVEIPEERYDLRAKDGLLNCHKKD